MHAHTRSAADRKSKVMMLDINNILSMSNPDYFSLDVEGSELAILKQIDWNVIKPPRCLTVECNFDKAKSDAICNLLSNHGYKLFLGNSQWLTKGDLWFVNSPAADTAF